MMWMYSLLIVAVSALLWRIRGGLWKEYIPANKIWYAVFFAVMSGFYFDFTWEPLLIGFVACYASYQLYGWGLYVGRLVNGGELRPNLVQYRECELIDDLLYSIKWTWKGQTHYLYQYPRWFGFFGTCLSGLIVSFLWGLFFGKMGFMLSGLAMGLCYWLGVVLNKVVPERKKGWGYGEWIFGAYLGAIMAWELARRLM